MINTLNKKPNLRQICSLNFYYNTKRKLFEDSNKLDNASLDLIFKELNIEKIASDLKFAYFEKKSK